MQTLNWSPLTVGITVGGVVLIFIYIVFLYRSLRSIAKGREQVQSRLEALRREIEQRNTPTIQGPFMASYAIPLESETDRAFEYVRARCPSIREIGWYEDYQTGLALRVRFEHNDGCVERLQVGVHPEERISFILSVMHQVEIRLANHPDHATWVAGEEPSPPAWTQARAIERDQPSVQAWAECMADIHIGVGDAATPPRQSIHDLHLDEAIDAERMRNFAEAMNRAQQAFNGFRVAVQAVPIPSEEAEERAKKLLKEYLSKPQKRQLNKRHDFVVRGSLSGDEYYYLIFPSMPNYQVRLYDNSGACLRSFCADIPGFPRHDVALASKIMLETNELAFLNLANDKSPITYSNYATDEGNIIQKWVSFKRKVGLHDYNREQSTAD